MNSLFTANGYCESGVVDAPEGRFDLAALPPFLRVLMSTDGTVTKSLEAFFWEPISVDKVRQADITLRENEPVLGAEIGQKVLERCVQLIGGHSGQVYVKAKSLIRTEVLPSSVREQLNAGALGIGELLRECGLETYREIVDIGLDKPSSTEGSAVWRRYRIVMAHQPFIQITEHFPLARYT